MDACGDGRRNGAAIASSGLALRGAAAVRASSPSRLRLTTRPGGGGLGPQTRDIPDHIVRSTKMVITEGAA